MHRYPALVPATREQYLVDYMMQLRLLIRRYLAVVKSLITAIAGRASLGLGRLRALYGHFPENGSVK